MENPNPAEKHGKLSSFLIALIFGSMWILVVFLSPQPIKSLPYSPQKPVQVKNDIDLNEVMRMGRQDLEHENLISEIRKDLKIPQEIEIKIFVGPFNNIVNEGQLLYPTNPFALILLLNENFYRDLNPEEKTALIGHELGHLTNDIVLLPYNSDIAIRFQIEADTYATKYARPEAMISILNKASAKYDRFQSRQYFLRIQNLEKIKRLQQAN